MNPQWQQQLLALNASLSAEQRIIFDRMDTQAPGDFIYPLSHLAVLKVSGKDAGKFLQGQCTCNIMELTPEKASFGAFCNAKGRMISNFIMLPNQADWLLILPGDLLTQVQKQLQKYILRADVQLTDGSADYCLTGLQIQTQDLSDIYSLPVAPLALVQQPLLCLRLGERYIFIADGESTQQLWSDLIARQFLPHSTSNWELLDICAGIPWLSRATSEAYIPQMINLDQLGGISFNKGCYTGQEIVARTHYLGKAKRSMFTARAELNETPAVNTGIIDTTQQIIGSVLACHRLANSLTLLIILTTDASASNKLALQNQFNTPITLV